MTVRSQNQSEDRYQAFRDTITKDLSVKITSGQAPWLMPLDPGTPRPDAFNAETGRLYSGMNALLMDSAGYSDPRWLSYARALAVGAQVRGGEKGMAVEYWKQEEEQDRANRDGILRPPAAFTGQSTIRYDRPDGPFVSTVFNAAQMDGLPPLERSGPTLDPCSEAAKLIAASGIRILQDQRARGFYKPDTDTIHMPGPDAFTSPEAFHAAALGHILAATGHRSRLDRDAGGGSGPERQAHEALVNALASFTVTTRLGLGHDPAPHSGHVKNWLERIEKDPAFLFRATAEAAQASDWVRSPDYRQTLEQEVRSMKTHDPVVIRTPEPAQAAEPAAPAVAQPVRKTITWLDIGSGDENMALEHGARFDSQEKAWYVRGEPTAELARFRAVPEPDPVGSFAKFCQAYGIVLDGPPKMDGQWHESGEGSYRAWAEGRPHGEFRYEDRWHDPDKASHWTVTPGTRIPERDLTWLKVHPVDQSTARRAGAWWDQEKKAWYTVGEPEGVLAQWRAQPLDQTITRLHVPFAEKEAAKAAGARWNKEEKVWYITGKPAEAVSQWLTAPASDLATGKAAAKAAGARWDKKEKVWYVTGKSAEAVRLWVTPPSRQPGQDPVEAFTAACRDTGLVLDGPAQMDGKWHRVAVADDRAGEKSGSYRGFLDGVPAGAIMNYRLGSEAVKWVASPERIPQQDMAASLARSQQLKAERDAELRDRQEKVSGWSETIWNDARRPLPNHAWLLRKGLPYPLARVNPAGQVVVPACDADGKVWNIQTIDPDGRKSFMKDGRVSGLMFTLPGKNGPDGPTVLAEGFSTAATVHHLTGHTVVVAFNAGNLPKVARTLREGNPGLDLVIAADDDHSRTINAGKQAAETASRETGARVLLPPLTPEEKARGLTDWNDLHVARGPVKAREALVAAGLETSRSRDQGRSQPRDRAAVAMAR